VDGDSVPVQEQPMRHCRGDIADTAHWDEHRGTPSDLLSCHAATVEGYALEGHVPAGAVLRLLAERPAAVRGLAVPAMPTGSPGIEVSGQPDDDYDVIAFDGGNGRRVFMRFRGRQQV
jgi:hypothetical protein